MTDKKKTVSELTDKELLKTAAKKVAEHARTASDAAKEEALHLADLFLKMIKGSITDEEKDELEEASVLQDIAHMPARVKCAVLGWHTMQELLKTEEK